MLCKFRGAISPYTGNLIKLKLNKDITMDVIVFQFLLLFEFILLGVLVRYIQVLFNSLAQHHVKF
jgi:hypothetical protein